MPTKQLILAPTLPEFKIETIPELALTQKNLLATKTAITAITTIESRDEAIAKSSLIATHLKAFEGEREKIKAPFLKACNEIDRVAREHRTSLEEEKKRLDLLIGSFEQEEQRKRDDEAAKLRKEAAEREAEIERKRKEVEAAAAKTTKSGAPTVSALAAALDVEEAEEEAAAERKANEDRQMALAEQQRKQSASGGARRMEIEVEVTDIKALYAAQPLCVELVPDISMIKGLHERGVELPGVTITKRPIFSTRAK